MGVRTLLLLAVLVASGCDAPFAVFPGGRLEGEVRPAPAAWRGVGDSGTMQLETRPAEPYSVNVAFTVLDGVLYVNAGDTETQWVQNMQADPRVRLRMDGQVHELAAERVTDESEIAAFAEAWTSQSFFRRDPTGLDEVWIYRLVAR